MIAAQQEDEKLQKVLKFLEDLQHPSDLTDQQYASFIRYCMCFFVKESKLWQRNPMGAHKVVIPKERHLTVLRECHDAVRHKGLYTTRSLVIECYWWPHVHEDLLWFVKTCHICQEHQVRQICISPIIATPASLFIKVYINSMHLLPSNKFRYIVQVCCLLTHYPEF